MATIYNKTALKKIKKDDLVQMFLDLQAKMNACEIENQELQEHYDNSIHTDWIAEKAGEDPEYYRDVCCADTLGEMIKENKKLKEEIEEYWKIDDDIGGVCSGRFKSIGEHLKGCHKEQERIRQRFIDKNNECNKLKNDLSLCAEGLIPNDLIQKGIVETCREKVKQLEEENEKLKKSNKKYHMECLKLNRELDDWHRALNEDVAGLEHLQSEINLHFWKRCHGPWDADIEKIKR